ncbi:MAG: LysR family transcriptional regulator [Burkholderiaceae bacterium]
MDSRLLEYFLRVAEFGSINRAASDLGLSQPALSRHIAALEHEMRASLFTRTRAGVRLTGAGMLLADRARPVLRQIDTLKGQIGEHARGQLAIGVPTSWQKLFTSDFAARFIARFPAVKLRLHEGFSNVIRESLLAGLLDLCVVPVEQGGGAGIRQMPLLREPLVLVGSASSGLDAHRAVPVTRLDGLPLVLPARGNLVRHQVESSLARVQSRFALAVETDTLALCLDFARQGVGSTVIPASAVAGQGDSIRWSPVSGLSIAWALYENEARTHAAAVGGGRRLALDVLSDSLAGNGWPARDRLDVFEGLREHPAPVREPGAA